MLRNQSKLLFLGQALSGVIPSTPTYEALIASYSGRVHHWKFDETGGDFADSVGSLTLTAIGILTYGVLGPAGKAVTFGTNSGRAISSGLTDVPVGASARSMVVVYKAGTTSKECLFSWGPTGSTRQWFTGFQNEMDTWGDDLGLGAGAAGHWHLYVATYDGSTAMQVTIDGQKFSRSLGAALNTGNSGNFQVGLSTNTDGWFSGTIGDVVMFNRVLTDAEIGSLRTALLASANWS